MSATAELAPALATASTSRRERAFTAVRILLGCLLLTAAGLKLYGLNVTAVPKVGWFATPRVQVAAIAWEMVLGFWLISGANPAWSWVAAFGTFVGFAGISGYFGWVGVANCGCFGVVRASPWAVFGVDVAALVLLAATRPDLGAGSVKFPSGILEFTTATGAVFIALAGVGWLFYGPPQLALARLRGDVLSVSPDHVDFGVVNAGQIVERQIEMQNWSDHPVRVIGGTSDCSCVTTSDLPITIPARDSRSVTVRMKIPHSMPGMLTRNAELWTDCDEERTIRLQIGCRVAE